MVRKLRVYELAKHYGVESPIILKMMRDMHAEAKSHMSVVEDDVIEKIHATYQRKREAMRLNYAKAHNLDPEKLKHVASFRPLDLPVAPDEPEAEKKPAKPAKKTAKKKVVAKKEPAAKAADEKAPKAKSPGAGSPAGKAATEVVPAEPDTAAKAPRKPAPAPVAAAEPEAPAKPPLRRARIIKRADVPVKAETVAEVAPAEAPAPAPEEAAAPDVATTVEVVEATEAETPAEAPEQEQDGGARPGPRDDKAGANARRPRRTAKVIRMGSGVVQTKTGLAVPEPRGPSGGPGGAPALGADGQPVENWNWGEVRRDIAGHRGRGDANSSVRDSVQAAMQRRQEVREGTPDSDRRKRRKKKKVDEVAVAQSVKQTLAQLDGAKGGRRRHRRGGGAEAESDAGPMLRVTEFITVQELAEKFEIQPREAIAKLFALGVMATMNQRLERDQIELLADEFEKDVEFLSEYGEEELADAEPDVLEEDLEHRAPVVTVMGHVDHGKTSLLDYIRKTNVIAGEAGGITQHIGAYRVQTPGGPITFLDTPGHEAFSAMRARGAQVTDIVILVVAADDRIMPQTIEAINHAKAAGVPLIVAINKIDLPGARPDLVKQDLLGQGIVVEEFGGDVLSAEISAKKGINIERLLELVHLQSEVLELEASSKGNARGVVVEASKEPGRGVIFTVLIEQGTLRVGDHFVCGMQDGKVRALLDERGEVLAQALPGEPAVVLGAGDVPLAGDRLHVTDTERESRDIAGKRRQLQRVQQFSAPKRSISLDNLAEMVAQGDTKELPIIVKGDVSGSVEAICDALLDLNTDEVHVRIVHKGVGAINESDVLLASNTGAMIIGFHMRPGNAIQERAKEQGVTIEVFDIIYEVVDTMRKAMAGLLGKIRREVSTGSAEIRLVYRIPKIGTVAGAYVTKGTIIRNSLLRLVRHEMMIFEGKISSLKRFKDDVREVQAGYECGIGLENFHDLQEGDVVETYRIEEETRTEL
ncbi:MAG: translation initiation factor IF-2 [Candidatus Latescibacteria bacterium]|nr:translation initiation factor IF-2 [Candidatus Latescibacterota bacterium]